MAKTNLRKQKSKSKLQIIFDQGTKFLCKSFVAIYLPISQNLDPQVLKNQDLIMPEHLNSTVPVNEAHFSVTIIASKKIGNAVKRNRSKRRLREIIRLHIKPSINSGMRLILLSRSATSIIEQEMLSRDCQNLIRKMSVITIQPDIHAPSHKAQA